MIRWLGLGYYFSHCINYKFLVRTLGKLKVLLHFKLHNSLLLAKSSIKHLCSLAAQLSILPGTFGQF